MISRVWLLWFLSILLQLAREMSKGYANDWYGPALRAWSGCNYTWWLGGHSTYVCLCRYTARHYTSVARWLELPGCCCPPRKTFVVADTGWWPPCLFDVQWAALSGCWRWRTGGAGALLEGTRCWVRSSGDNLRTKKSSLRNKMKMHNDSRAHQYAVSNLA